MLDREELRRQMEQQDAKRSRGRVKYFPKNKTTNLRILAFNDEEGKGHLARSVSEYRTVGGKFILDRQTTFGAACGATRLEELATAKGQDSPFSRRRTTWYVNAINLDENPEQVHIWQLPTTVWEVIVEMLLQDEWADVLDPKKGHSFSVKKTGEGLDTEYSTTVSRSPVPVKASVVSQVVDPLTEVNDPGLEAQCRQLGVSVEDLWEDIDDLEMVEAQGAQSGREASQEAPKGPGKKKTKKKSGGKKKSAPACPHALGSAVTKEFDGTPFEGEVTDIDEEAQTVGVRWEDGDETVEKWDDVEGSGDPDDDLPFVPGSKSGSAGSGKSSGNVIDDILNG